MGALDLQNDAAGDLATAIERVFSERLLPKGPECYDIDKMSWLMAAISSSSYAIDRMRSSARFDTSDALLEFAVGQASGEGLDLEFGVYSGTSINAIARRRPGKTVYGFDSFEGLPEAWFPGTQKGIFDLGGVLPLVEPNVELVQGWFDEALPAFLNRHPGVPVSFLHVDCDIYSSTVTIFNSLKDRIQTGTIILFDEYMNYPEWERHEFKAWQEFVVSRRLSYEYIGLTPTHMKVAVRVL